jgi:hypothetical protein
MTSAELENLARIGKLKKEPPLLREYEGLLRSADSRLADAENESNSLESRFDLAYGASHALALAALRRAARDRRRRGREEGPGRPPGARAPTPYRLNPAAGAMKRPA